MKRDFIFSMVVFFLAGCEEQILHDLDELRANQVQIALSRADIESEKTRQGKHWNISVASARSADALLVIERSRILRRTLERNSGSGGLLQTSEEKSRGYEREAAARTEETLERIPGVLEARVHIYRESAGRKVIPQPVGTDTASVLLVTENDAPLNLHEIRSFVGGASGVKAENISVLVSSSGERLPEQRARGSFVRPQHALIASSVTLAERAGTAFSFGSMFRIFGEPWFIGASTMIPVVAFFFLRMRHRQSREVFQSMRVHPGEEPRASAEREERRLRRPFGPEADVLPFGEGA